MEPSTRKLTRAALNHFERLARPVKTYFITSTHLDHFVSQRRQEQGRRPRSLVSPATINKELRHLRAVLGVAKDWGYLPQVPRFRFLREEQALPTYVTGDHFALIYGACEKAKRPRDLPNVSPADWWRALLVMAYMTGWRIDQMLSLQRDKLDLDAGTVRSRAGDTKGKREVLIKLHPVVLDHLRRLKGFDPRLFPWNYHNVTLYRVFLKIQQAAGINLPCDEDHEHSEYCHVYGFHDFRRAFATMNADKLTADALQALMQHKSYQTTQRYVNMARQMDAAVASLHVPEVLRQSGPA
jgi:integrase